MADSALSQNSRKIQRNLEFLCKHTTNLESVLTALVSEDVIQPAQKESFENGSNAEQKAYKMYSFIMKKSTDVVYSILLNALHENGNTHITELLEEDQNIRERRYSEGLNPNIHDPGEKTDAASPYLEKWWPEEKVLTRSFVERNNNNGQWLIRDLKQMLENSKAERGIGAQKVTLSGMPGIGKTTTAKWFAKEYQSDYTHIIWLDCGEGSVESCMGKLAAALTANTGKEQKIVEMNEFAPVVYLMLENYKCLFVFDNAEDFESVKDFLPVHPLHQSLITSRDQNWGSKIGYGEICILNLSIFSAHDATAFITKALKKSKHDLLSNEETSIAVLASKLGYLPLALHVAVATMFNNSWNPSTYLGEMKIYGRDLLLGSDTVVIDYGKSVRAAVDISMKQIAKRLAGKSKLTSDILNIFGYFAPENISIALILYLVNGTRMEIQSVLNILKQFSLVTVDTNRDYYIHRLLQKLIREKQQHHEDQVLLNFLSRLSKFDKQLQSTYEHHIWEVWYYGVKHATVIDKLPDFFVDIAMHRSIKFRHDEDTTEFFKDALPHINRLKGKKDITSLQIKFQLAHCLFRVGRLDDCIEIWEHVLSELLEPLSMISFIIEFFSPYDDNEKRIHDKCIQAAKFNIRVAGEKKNDVDDKSLKIIRVKFSESILEQFTVKMIQRITLEQVEEAWNTWNTKVGQFFLDFENLHQVASIADLLLTALIQNKNRKEASIVYNGLYSRYFPDPIMFEIYNTSELVPLISNSGAIEHFVSPFKEGIDVQKAVGLFHKMTILLQNGQKPPNSKIDDDEPDEDFSSSDSIQGQQYNVDGEFEKKMKIEKFDSAFQSRWLTSVHFKYVQFKKFELIATLQDCVGLKSIILEKVKMIGGCRGKIYLPNLRTYVIDLVDHDWWEGLLEKYAWSTIMSSMSFFYKNDSQKEWEMNNCNQLELERYKVSLDLNTIEIKSSGDSIECELKNYDSDEILKPIHFVPTRMNLKSSKVSVDCILQFGYSLKHLILYRVKIIAADIQNGIQLSDSLLKLLPHLEVFDIDAENATPISIKINNLPRTLRRLRLRYITIITQNCESPTIYEVKQLTLIWVTFCGVDKNRGVELTPWLLSHFPSVQVLDLDVYGSTPISLNVNNLPAAVKEMRLKAIELIYTDSLDERAQYWGVGTSNMHSKVQHSLLHSISLLNVVLPHDEHCIRQLLGDTCKNVFVDGNWGGIQATPLFLEKIMKIDSVQCICIQYFNWESTEDGQDNSEFVELLKQFEISDGTDNFYLERVQESKTSGEAEISKNVWLGKKLPRNYFYSLRSERFAKF